MFDRKSRYAKLEPYDAVDRRGRKVKAVPVPDAPPEIAAGEHVRKEGERLDHLAGAYLGDGTAFWRIAELNDVMLPEALSETPFVTIPTKVRLG